LKVEFFRWPASLASGRLRGSIPQRELEAMGIQQGRDIVIASKHGWPDALVKDAGKVIFDVCDDHFSTEGLGDHYLRWCLKADAVTCNTHGMAETIKAHTGRIAFVIPDPYEQPERPPRVHEHLLWFGHRSNLPDLRRVLPSIEGRPLLILTNDTPGYAQWSPEAMDAAFDTCGLVVIPTGKRQAKSANRAVESIRRGLFVVAEPLPAYSELGIWIGDIRQGVEWALSHQDEAIRRIKAAQAYVREEFCPRRIARMWLEVFKVV
jgi:hypothetical protein